MAYFALKKITRLSQRYTRIRFTFRFGIRIDNGDCIDSIACRRKKIIEKNTKTKEKKMCVSVFALLSLYCEVYRLFIISLTTDRVE